jgi:hypothetical protein
MVVRTVLRIFRLCKCRWHSYTEVNTITVAASTIISAAAGLTPVTGLEVI